jgi:hypothetical protein
MANKLHVAALQWILVFPVIALAGFTAGLSMAPAIYCFDCFQGLLKEQAPWIYYPGMGFTIALTFYCYGMCLILIAPFLNLIMGGRLKPFRGSAVSLKCIPWYIHSCFTLLVRYTFLEFVTPTPFSVLYYRLMGMKVGSNVTINTTAISDPSMIEMADKVTIGGSACILAHYSQGGFLVISKVIFKKGATIGLRAIVMGGCEIGERAKVLAGSFVLPNTKIPKGETWGGIPAVRVKISKIIGHSE